MTFNNDNNKNNNNMNPAGRGKKRPCLDAAPESRKHLNTGNVDGGNRNEEHPPSADNDLEQGPWILVEPGKTKPKDVSRPAAKSVIPSKTVQQFAVAETKRTSVSETEHVRTDNVGTDIVNGKQENDIEKKVVVDPANSGNHDDLAEWIARHQRENREEWARQNIGFCEYFDRHIAPYGQSFRTCTKTEILQRTLEWSKRRRFDRQGQPKLRYKTIVTRMAETLQALNHSDKPDPHPRVMKIFMDYKKRFFFYSRLEDFYVDDDDNNDDEEFVVDDDDNSTPITRRRLFCHDDDNNDDEEFVVDDDDNSTPIAPRRLFCHDDDNNDDEEFVVDDDDNSTPIARRRLSPTEIYREQLGQIKEMGYEDEPLNLVALQQCNGNGNGGGNSKQENDIEKKVVIDPVNSDSIIENGNDGSKLTGSVDLVNNSSADDSALDNGIENVSSTNVVAEKKGAYVPFYNDPDGLSDGHQIQIILRLIRRVGRKGPGCNPPPPVGEWKPTTNFGNNVPQDVWVTIASFLYPYDMNALEVAFAVRKGSITRPASKLFLKSLTEIAEDYWREESPRIHSIRSVEDLSIRDQNQLEWIRIWNEDLPGGYELFENETWHGVYTFLFSLLQLIIVDIEPSLQVRDPIDAFRHRKGLLALVIWLTFGVPSLPNTILNYEEDVHIVRRVFSEWPSRGKPRWNDISEARMRDILARACVCRGWILK